VIDRGLWVSADETLVCVATHPSVLKWVKNVGVTTFSTGNQSLGNLVVDPWGNLVVTDRYGNRVYRLDSPSNPTPIADNGTKSGGGDGQLALNTGLEEVRGVWFLPTGAYLVCTHKAAQVWYVDTTGYIHLFLNGYYQDQYHAGGGTWFYNPGEQRVGDNHNGTTGPGRSISPRVDLADAVWTLLLPGRPESRLAASGPADTVFHTGNRSIRERGLKRPANDSTWVCEQEWE
jgi:hypothetical protein